MVKQSVLVVEDEDEIRELVSYNLLTDGYQVAAVASGEEALAMLQSRPIDLLLLDLMLPDIDGLTICRQLKSDAKTAAMPIIMMTVKGEEIDIVTGLEVGADDYMVKPFSPKVLLARVSAVLRRAMPGERGPETDLETVPDIKVHDLEIQPSRHQVLYRRQPIELSSTEFRVLRLLASKPGWVLTRQQIISGIHGEDCAVTDRAVDVQIAGLRKKLGPAAKYIETVRGVGYRLKQ